MVLKTLKMFKKSEILLFLLWINQRACCQQFLLVAVDREVCELSRVMGTLFLERDVELNYKLNKFTIHPYYIGMAADISETIISKPGQKNI